MKKELSQARVDILEEAEQIIKPERIAKMENYIKQSIKQLDSLENKVKNSETRAIQHANAGKDEILEKL